MMYIYCHLRKRQRQRGVTLIEILITIVLMAFGLLGVVLMQTISLKSNHESSQRTSANYLAEDIISRIRSVPLASLGGYHTGTDAVSTSEPSNKCTSSSKCTITEKITYDLWRWKELLDGSSSLVNASGCIQISNNQIRIIISWDGIGKSKASSTTSCGTAGSSLKRRSLTVYTLL